MHGKRLNAGISKLKIIHNFFQLELRLFSVALVKYWRS
jgi:hypothetical protein